MADDTHDTRDLQEAFRAADAERLRIDLRDFYAEQAGLVIGRIPRFYSETVIERLRERRSGGGHAAGSEYLSRLQLLLAMNATYARLYDDTFALLREAEAATERAIAKAQQALEEAQGTLEQTLARAATLPDGTRVFRDARGQVWTEHGQRVSEADAAGIEWRGDEPAYETFIIESEAVADSLTRLEALQGFRVNTLGHMRGRMMDQDNPPSPAEMEQFAPRVREQMRALQIEENITATAPAVQATVAVASLDIPDLS